MDPLNPPKPDDPPFELLPKRARAYLYRVTASAGPLVTAYGIMDGKKWALWLGLASAVLGSGTAVVHTSTKP